MSNGNIFKSALIGGVALGIVSVLPFLEAFNCICCAWAIAGGILAANIYIKDSKASTDLPSHFEPSSPASDLYNKDSKVSTDSPTAVTLGRGAGIGLVTGVIGAVVNLLFSIPLRLLSGNNDGAEVVRSMQEMFAKAPNVPPEFQQALNDLAANGDINRTLLIFSFIGNLVLFPLFAMMGGAIGVAIFEKRKPGDSAEDAPR